MLLFSLQISVIFSVIDKSNLGKAKSAAAEIEVYTDKILLNKIVILIRLIIFILTKLPFISYLYIWYLPTAKNANT